MGMGWRPERLAAAQSQCGGCGQACGEISGAPLALKRRLTQHLSAMGDDRKRIYLVVVDDSPEARVALRFAARRAAKTGGRVEVLGIAEAQDFVQFGGVQAAIEEEQKLRIEGVVSSAIGEILDESGVEAKIIIQQGAPVRTVRDYVGERPEVAALVLGAAPSGSPGPLVANFTGNDAGKLSCPVMIIPGSLSDERLEQLS
jgi:nucleotide-binding universal stress UspA family protein